MVINNFDMGSEKYDFSLFRIMVEEVVRGIEFPIFNLDLSDEINSIAGKFNGEITSARQKTELSIALSKGISRIYDELCNKLILTVEEFRNEISEIGRKVEDNLLNNMTQEFEVLIAQCENKNNEINVYKKYVAILEKNLAKLK